MRYAIQEIDKETLLQNSLDYKIRCFVVTENKNIIGELDGIITCGSPTVSSESDVRRTFSVTLQLDELIDDIEQKISGWIGYTLNIEIGIYNLRLDDYCYYPCGYYVITAANTTYDSRNNSLSLELGDWMNKLNGIRNGQIGGAPTITIPVEYNGTKTTLRSAMMGVIEQQGNIRDYILDDVGEFYGMPANNSDYLTYQKNNPDWNILPYDLQFDVGCAVLDIILKIRDLYPNCQVYFDVYNNLCFNMLPSCQNDPILLDNDYLQSILVAENSESVSYNIQSIKNVTEVFGKAYDVDNMSTSCTSSGSLYTITLNNYTAYGNYDYIAFTPNTTNIVNTTLQINSLASCPIYYENKTEYIPAGTLLKGETYVVQARKIDNQFRFYFLGQYQPHALCVLTSDANDPYYTKKYFQTNYDCDNILFRVEKDSPFTVQKLGIVLDVKTGDTFGNIRSDSVALETAKYYNRFSSSMNDTVTITTKCIPFLDIHEKVSYKKQQEEEEHNYIIKNLTHNFDTAGNKTTTITMYRFYPLY